MERTIPPEIAAYTHQRNALLESIRRCDGEMSQDEFDAEYRGRTKPFGLHFLEEETLLLSGAVNGQGPWAMWLELLQLMVQFGFVKSEKRNGRMYYYETT